MISSRVTPIDQPRPFEPHELFFSLTDTKGRIRYGNEVFTRVSGYSEEELLGKPHNLIRHPDMPRCVFQLLWDYLEAGKTIAAYVKNLAADGCYYWVLAVVTPCRDGYLSVRLNPSSPLFEAAKALYAEVLSFESGVEADRGKRAAIEEATDQLVERLRVHGFASYGAFMHTALKAELEGRQAFAKPSSFSDGSSHDREPLDELSSHLTDARNKLSQVFRSLAAFETLSQGLTLKNVSMEELGPSLSVLALNANIAATRLGSEGAVLSVVSKELGENSKVADRVINQLLGGMKPCCELARSIGFEIAAAHLEVEVCEDFVAELKRTDASDHDTLVAESLLAITSEFTGRCQAILASLDSLWSDTEAMEGALIELAECVSKMQLAKLNGKIDVASRPNAAHFEAVFEDVAAIVRESKADCEQIAELLEETACHLRPLLREAAALRSDLCGVDLATSEIASQSAVVSA